MVLFILKNKMIYYDKINKSVVIPLPTSTVPTSEGYNRGYADGVAHQKELITSLTVTENGTYENENGYSPIEVNIEGVGTYEEGYEQGMVDGSASGLDAGTADGAATGYDQGYANGKNVQSARIEQNTIFTSNGVYERENGWNHIAVRVPATDNGKPTIYYEFDVEFSSDTTLNLDGDYYFEGVGYNNFECVKSTTMGMNGEPLSSFDGMTIPSGEVLGFEVLVMKKGIPTGYVGGADGTRMYGMEFGSAKSFPNAVTQINSRYVIKND